MDEHATGRRIVIQPPDDEGFNPITIQSSPRDGSVQLRQADWMGNASVVCFEPRQAEQVIASIREHATGEGMREATSRENPVIARLQRELKAQREGMGREIGRLQAENEKLWEELVWPFENSDGEWFTLTNVDVSGVETEKYGAPPNEDDGLCYFPTKEGCIAAVREALCLPPLPNSGPDGEGSDTD